MKLTVVLLSGGQSTRFWPLEEKNLVQFFGIPLIAYQLKRYAYFLKQYSTQAEFIVVGNSSNIKTIEQAINTTQVTNFKLVLQNKKEQRGAILAALEKTKLNNPVLVANSNDIFSEQLINTLIKKTAQEELILCATKVQSYLPGGYLEIDEKTRSIKKIWEKPPQHLVPQKLQYFRFVFDYFPKPGILLKALEKSGEYEDAINKLLTQQKSSYIVYNGSFATLKYPWHVLDATQLFLSNIKQNLIKTNNIDGTAQIVGRVYIEKGVKIGSFSKIVGPCYIGKNTTIADYSLVRESHIGEDCLVGAFSEVARSYLGSHVFLHRNYVGDSVLSENVSMGAGAITANWRFDEENIRSPINKKIIDSGKNKLGAIIGRNTKIGISACIMPGVKIGSGNLVLPNSTVYKDIPDNKSS